MRLYCNITSEQKPRTFYELKCKRQREGINDTLLTMHPCSFLAVRFIRYKVKLDIAVQ